MRPIVSCKGTTCVFGLIDTFALSEKIHERFYKGYHSVKLPHKFKIAVGGCPNNCVKPDINDLGIIGQHVISPKLEVCRGCSKCAVMQGCPMGAANLEDGKIKINAELCNNCGRCTSKCPFGVFNNYECGYKVYIGGRWGKKCARGIPLSKVLTSEEEVLLTVEKAILFFKSYGILGERFGDTIARVGFEEAERIIFSDTLISERDAIISAPLK